MYQNIHFIDLIWLKIGEFFDKLPAMLGTVHVVSPLDRFLHTEVVSPQSCVRFGLPKTTDQFALLTMIS